MLDVFKVIQNSDFRGFDMASVRRPNSMPNFSSFRHSSKILQQIKIFPAIHSTGWGWWGGLESHSMQCTVCGDPFNDNFSKSF